MEIAAKFASTCPQCGDSILPGTRVQWEPGRKAQHVQCSGRPAAAAPRAKKIDAPFVRQEKWEPCKRTALARTEGTVRVASGPRWAQGPEAVAEGDAFVVVAQTERYESASDNEDMGDMSGPGWQVTLRLRRATEEEAAKPLAAYRARQAAAVAKAHRATLVREVVKLCEAGMWAGDADAVKPSGRELEIDPGVHGSGRKVLVVSEDGGGVAVWCNGYYDDYRATLAVTRDPRAVALAAELLSIA